VGDLLVHNDDAEADPTGLIGSPHPGPGPTTAEGDETWASCSVSSAGSKASSAVITPGVVFGGAAVIGAINVVLMTALFTVGTFIYNLCSDLVGGLEITLSERD